jgi:SAM-dependent methyltransferase
MPSHDPTGRRFGEAAAAYERGRPEYPEAIIDWLLADGPSTVVDLGAGTGKLTRGLVGRVETVVAVEPDRVMRAAFSERLPGTSVVTGTAEDIPLRDGYADVIVAGQAWHWVDAVRALPEVARVLRPAGTLGLVWNDRDEDDPWIARLSGILEAFGTSPDAAYEPSIGEPFGSLEVIDVRWTNHATVDAVVDMVVSRSYVIALHQERRDDLVRQVRELAYEGVDRTTALVPVHYVTRGYRARLSH